MTTKKPAKKKETLDVRFKRVYDTVCVVTKAQTQRAHQLEIDNKDLRQRLNDACERIEQVERKLDELKGSFTDPLGRVQKLETDRASVTLAEKMRFADDLTRSVTGPCGLEWVKARVMSASEGIAAAKGMNDMTDFGHGEVAALEGVRSHVWARLQQVKAEDGSIKIGIIIGKTARLDELVTLLEALDAVITQKRSGK